MRMFNVIGALHNALSNMHRYPGLFGVFEMASRDLPDSAVDEIAKIISQPMSDDDVDRVFAILDAVADGRYVVAAAP